MTLSLPKIRVQRPLERLLKGKLRQEATPDILSECTCRGRAAGKSSPLFDLSQ